MKIQLTILKQLLKKNIFWILLLFLLASLSFITYQFRPLELEYTKNDLLQLLCYPGISNKNFFGLLLSIYQISFTIYFVYSFFTYEVERSFSNIILRSNQKRWIIYKLVVCVGFVFFLQFFYVLFLVLLFMSKISISLDYFMIPITIHMGLTVITMIFCTYISNIVGLFFLFIVASYGCFLFYHPLVFIIIFVITIYFVSQFKFYKLLNFNNKKSNR